ncbi:cadmium-translocating P-type ATPase [candidate division KSB1 bacterium]|nr:cadmium-translocating P-type ATPase [candidate division KSB1 bacterium]
MTRLYLENLDCASCAAKIEDGLAKLPKVRFVSVNFVHSTLQIDTPDLEQARRKIKEIEPDVNVLEPEETTRASFDRPSKLVSFKQALTENKTEFLKIGITALLLLAGLIFHETLENTPFQIAKYVVFIPAYVLSGWRVLSGAVKSIARARVFNEHFLMTIATLGAIAIGELAEAVTVMLFYIIGELFQDIAVNRSRRSVKALLQVRPDTAHLVVSAGQPDEHLERVSPEQVHPGQRIVVKPGEKIPLDGVVRKGDSFVDTYALTGESVPRAVKTDERVLAGMINKSSLLTVEVTKEFSESSIAKILELVENASSKKAETEKFITTFARYYTPVIVLGALLLALIPPLIIQGATFSEWIYRALVVLVISCPCALVISVPLAYFGGIGKASRSGILVKGSNFLDALTNLKTVVFDKTGTLTKGEFKVTGIHPVKGYNEKEVLRYAAYAQANSNHPIAQSVLQAYRSHFPDEPIQRSTLHDVTEIAGHGVRVRIDGEEIVAGNARLLSREKIQHEKIDIPGTVVYVAVNKTLAGHLVISDSLKKHAAETIQALQQLNIKTSLLTGDNQTIAREIARELGIENFHAELLPEDKVHHIEKLIDSTREGRVAFVGDGINDAPVIARADVGFAMGALGSDAAVETADVVLMTDSPNQVVKAIQIARHTRKIVWQNIALALGIKAFFIVLGTLGIATMWEAVFGDMGVALIAILNSVRGAKDRRET